MNMLTFSNPFIDEIMGIEERCWTSRHSLTTAIEKYGSRQYQDSSDVQPLMKCDREQFTDEELIGTAIPMRLVTTSVIP